MPEWRKFDFQRERFIELKAAPKVTVVVRGA